MLKWTEIIAMSEKYRGYELNQKGDQA